MKKSAAYKSDERKQIFLLIVAIVIGLGFAAGIFDLEAKDNLLGGILLFAVVMVVETEIIYYMILLEEKYERKKFNSTETKGVSIILSFLGISLLLFVWLFISQIVIPNFQTVLSIIIAVMVGLLIAGLIIIIIVSWYSFNKNLAIKMLGKKRVK